MDRLAVLRVIDTALQQSSEEFAEALLLSNILIAASDLFLQFEWNSILHNLYFKIVDSVIKGTHEGLKQHLLEDCELISMLKVLGENTEVNLGGRQFRRGSNGNAFRLANFL